MRNVRALFVALGVLIYSQSVAQCLELQLSLEAKTVSSSLITEAKVISTTTRWNEDHSLILTEYGLDVHKVLKGDLGASVLMVVTYGGSIGDTGLVTSSYLPLQIGDYGLFFLNDDNNQIYTANGQQSLIRYQQDMKTAYDNYSTFSSIKKDLYQPISKLTGHKARTIKETPSAQRKTNSSLGDQVYAITSFSPASIVPGALDTLTLNGSGFGNTRCENCYVYFKNADAPSTYFAVPSNYYTYWSDEKVKVVVPGNGVGFTPGSGNFYLTNENGQQLIPSTTIDMPYAVLNNYVGSNLNRVSLVNNNNKGGYTLTLDQNVASNPEAVNALKRAIQTWRCEAGINFEIAPASSNVTCPVKDNINSVSFSKPGCNFPSTPLAQTMIWYTCKYILEVDIVFNSSYSFDYEKGSTPTSKYDFESVALHELGHAFGMGHTIGTGKVMHPILQNGTEVTSLSVASEISGAASMIQYSSQNGCSQAPYTAVKNNCALMPPSAKFSVSSNSGCAPFTVQMLNGCSGASSYSWDINNDGTIDYTTSSPQHTFNATGQYCIKVTASNAYGSDSYTLTNAVTVKAKPTASISGSATTSLCEGNTKKLTANASNAETLQWRKNGIDIPGAVGTTYTTAQSGNYTILANANNCPSANSPAVTVNKVNPPSVNLELKSDTLFCMPQNLNKYGWLLNGNYLEGESKPWIVVKAAGDYKAIGENAGGCSDTSTSFAYRLTPVAENATDDIFSLFPNPATDKLNINVGSLPSKHASIRITNMMGANVLHQDNLLTSIGDRLEIPVSNLPSGLYIVQIESEDKAYTKKFIKN